MRAVSFAALINKESGRKDLIFIVNNFICLFKEKLLSTTYQQSDVSKNLIFPVYSFFSYQEFLEKSCSEASTNNSNTTYYDHWVNTGESSIRNNLLRDMTSQGSDVWH